MTITGKEARHAIWDDSEDFEFIDSELIDTSRWSIIYEAILKHTESGKYFKTPNYRVGATESQDEQPFEYEDKVLLKEVEQKEVTIKQWVKV
jgi:hypothetical protein